jgi:DNA-binding transcriptional LysR family regulator
VDLQQLRVLAEVARTGSYTAAGAALGYTQPAVSYQMRRLQHAVGAPVVVRVGRGLQLTEIGHTLVQHAETIFAVMRAADQEMASVVARGGGLVRIVAFQSVCTTLLPTVITRMRNVSDRVRIDVVQAEPVEARDLIRTGRADIGILCDWANEDRPGDETTMLRVELLTDRRVALMRDDHPMAGRETIGLGDLADADWVMESFRDRFEAACTNLGFAPHVVATVDDLLAIQSLVAAGLGISLVSELSLYAHLAPPLIYRPVSNWPRRRTYALLWPDMVKVPAVAAVLQEIKSVARRTVTRPPATR